MIIALVALTNAAWMATSPMGGGARQGAQTEQTGPQVWHVRRDVFIRSMPTSKGNQPISLAKRGTFVTGKTVYGQDTPDEPWIEITEGPHTGQFVWKANMKLKPPPKCEVTRTAALTVRVDQLAAEPEEVRAMRSRPAPQETPQTVSMSVVCRVTEDGVGDDVYELARSRGGGVFYGSRP